MPIVSLFLGVYAYSSWHSNVESFDDQISNWKTDPVLSIVFSADTTCPNGYALQVPKPFNYTTVSCDCSSKSVSSTTCDSQSSTDWYSCTSTQSSCGCKSVTTSRSFSVPKWPGIYPYMCIQRASGQNALARARATAGVCASGTHLCNYDDCLPDSMSCPITNVTSVSPSVQSSGGWVGSVDQNTTGYIMVYNRSVSSMDPLAITPEVEVLIGQDTSSGARPDSRYRTAQQYSVQDALNANDASYVQTLINQNQAGYLSTPWMITMREEIPWLPKCPTTRTRLNTLHDKVAIIDKAQLAVMLISIGISIYNFIAATHDYNEMTDDDPNNDGNMAKKKAVCNMVGEVVNLVPTIIALAIASTIYHEFNDMKNFGGCSDSIANAPLNSLAKKLNDLATINVVKTAASALYLAFRIAVYLRSKYCPSSNISPGKTHVQDTQLAIPPDYNPNQQQ